MKPIQAAAALFISISAISLPAASAWAAGPLDKPPVHDFGVVSSWDVFIDPGERISANYDERLTFSVAKDGGVRLDVWALELRDARLPNVLMDSPMLKLYDGQGQLVEPEVLARFDGREHCVALNAFQTQCDPRAGVTMTAALTAGLYSLTFQSRNAAGAAVPTFHFGVSTFDNPDKDAYLAAVIPAVPTVPEPSTAATLALGLALLSGVARTARRSSAHRG